MVNVDKLGRSNKYTINYNLLDRVRLVALRKDLSSIMIVLRLGRSIHHILSIILMIPHNSTLSQFSSQCLVIVISNRFLQL